MNFGIKLQGIISLLDFEIGKNSGQNGHSFELIFLITSGLNLPLTPTLGVICLN